VDDEAVRDALGLAGVFLCMLGLLYGGFWRIQMRRRFGLPENRACCSKTSSRCRCVTAIRLCRKSCR
jgi:hypothetical protein